MAFHDVIYAAHVFLGDPTKPPLWEWSAWRALLPALDPLMHSSRGAVSVRSSQERQDNGETVRFGRIGWTEAGHHKWAHHSPLTGDTSEGWTFQNIEAWAPGWGVCERQGRAPAVFLSVTNEAMSGTPPGGLAFNPVVILAVEQDRAAREGAALAALVAEIARLLVPRFIGRRNRPWGLPSGSGGYTDSIQDLPTSGLLKPGPRHAGEVGPHLLAEEWERAVTPCSSAPPRCR